MNYSSNLWPIELAATKIPHKFAWTHALSNVVLDFHGDPCKANLTVLSDGNHHMALEQVLQNYLSANPQVNDIFYSTTPPRILKNIIATGGLQLGNLSLTIRPNIVLSPQGVMENLKINGHISEFFPFMQNRGSVLLVRRGNPKNIQGLQDLMRNDIKLFISNPKTETVSFESYKDTLVAMAKSKGFDYRALANKLENGAPQIIHGEQIHHREAFISLLTGTSDVAILYYHLALRYTRILPGQFLIVHLVECDSEIPDKNVISTIYAAVAGRGSAWGNNFLNYLASDEVTEVYQYHGLDRPQFIEN